MEEQELIQLAVKGDLDAFNQVALAHQERVFNQAFRILGESMAAEDIAQEAILAAYLKLKTYRGGSFKAWILRITSNLCFDYLRREKVRPTVALEPVDEYGEEVESAIWMVDPGLSPQDIMERSAFWDDFQKCLDRLPVEYRMAVVLVDIQELDYAEAAQVMNVSIGTLKSRLVRGRLKMRELLKRRDTHILYTGRKVEAVRKPGANGKNRSHDEMTNRAAIAYGEPC
jgi:RNA polymerase sigma-70 factor, ECF subfamily